MNDKIKEYKEKMNWDVWEDLTPLNTTMVHQELIRPSEKEEEKDE